MTDVENEATRPLEGLKVVDAATLFAGPVIGCLMGDFGADVIKVEHPRGDNLRGLGYEKDGVSLWWAFIGRNKRSVTADLKRPEGRDLLLRLLADADVFIEGFRPGTLERWGLAPEILHAANPGLVIVRTSGFGQDGPYSTLPGFGTLAEAMSGFAEMNGWPDSPPTLPPYALADGIAGVVGTYATMFALWWREHAGAGAGQVIDLAIYEPLFWVLGPQALLYDQLGIVPSRTGNAASFTAPRNAYPTKDDQWIAISASAQTIAERTMRAVGRPDLIEVDWFASHEGRLAHSRELDDAIGTWMAERDAEEILRVFAEHQAAAARVYSIADIFEDPHYAARGTLASVEHPRLGTIRMPNVIPRLSASPGRVDHAGCELGAHNEAIYCEGLGIPREELARLRADGVV